MRAVVYTGAGGPEVIAVRDVPNPIPREGQMRVRVVAAGLNRADLIQRKGGYPAPSGWPADIPGLEYAGEVEALGPDVSRWRPGDRVMGLVGGGAQAELVVAYQDEAVAIPTGLSFIAAAAIPEAFFTAYDALVTRARLTAGERVLIHAVGSGVGTAAVQLVKWLGGTAIGTSRSGPKLEQARALGLDQGIDVSKRSFKDSLSQPVDVILDFLGGAALDENLAVLAPRGRLVLLGTLQGARAPDVDLGRVLRGRLEVIGTVMRTRGREERSALAVEFGGRVAPLFAGDRPRLRPVVGAVFPLARVAEAHAAMEGSVVFGKVVLDLAAGGTDPNPSEERRR